MNREYFKSLQAFLILIDLLVLTASQAAAFMLNSNVLEGNSSSSLVAVMLIHTAWFIFYFLSGNAFSYRCVFFSSKTSNKKRRPKINFFVFDWCFNFGNCLCSVFDFCPIF